jgi:hypothetical protein
MSNFELLKVLGTGGKSSLFLLSSKNIKKKNLSKFEKAKFKNKISQTYKEFKWRKAKYFYGNQMSGCLFHKAAIDIPINNAPIFPLSLSRWQKPFSPSGVCMWGDATATCRCEKSGCCTQPGTGGVRYDLLQMRLRFPP